MSLQIQSSYHHKAPEGSELSSPARDRVERREEEESRDRRGTKTSSVADSIQIENYLDNQEHHDPLRSISVSTRLNRLTASSSGPPPPLRLLLSTVPYVNGGGAGRSPPGAVGRAPRCLYEDGQRGERIVVPATFLFYKEIPGFICYSDIVLECLFSTFHSCPHDPKCSSPHHLSLPRPIVAHINIQQLALSGSRKAHF